MFVLLNKSRKNETQGWEKVLVQHLGHPLTHQEISGFQSTGRVRRFDLIFGAAKQTLKIIEAPIHYKTRTFGETQIPTFATAGCS